MGLTADTIAVEIIGRIDKLEAAMRSAQTTVSKTADKMKKDTEKIGFFDKPETQKNLLRFISTFFLLDRLGKGLANTLELVNTKMREGLEVGKRTDAVVKDITEEFVKSVPFIGQFVKAGESLFDLLSGAAEQAANLNRDLQRGADILKFQTGLIGIDDAIKAFRDQTALDSLEGKEDGLFIKARIELEKIDKQVKDLKESLLDTFGLNFDSAAIKSRLASIDDSAKRAKQNILNELKRDREELEKKNNPVAIKKQGSFSDDFQTAMGNVRFLQGGGAGAQRVASEDTAKVTAANTKATVGKLQELINKIQSGGILFG